MAHSLFFAILCTLALLAPLVIAVDDSPEESDVDDQHKHHCGRHGHHHGHHHGHDHPNHHHHPHHRHHPHHHHEPKDVQPNTNVATTVVDEVTQPAAIDVQPVGNAISDIFDENFGQSITNNAPVDVDANAVSSNVHVENKDHHQEDHDIVHGQKHELGLDETLLLK